MSNVFPDLQRMLNPVSDFFRAPFSVEFDWKRTIDESGLPEDVRAVIRSVVAGSRLWRFEKAQVTADLVAHFQDGKSRGKSFLKLIDNFGEPETAAALIRTSKMRSRPVIAKLFRGGMWTGLAAGLAYAGLTVFFHLGEPNPSTNFIPEFNGDIGQIADEDRAWNIYRPVWTEYEFCEGPGAHFDEIYFHNEGHEDHMRLVRSTDGAQWNSAIRKLEDSADLLDSFREGAKLPGLGLELQSDPNLYSRMDRAALFPGQNPDGQVSDLLEIEGIDEETAKLIDGSLMSILLPHIQCFRNAARILTVDTRVAMEQEDYERATQNIETVFGMSHQAAESSCLVCGLVGIAVHGIGCDLIDETIRSDPALFSEEQLARIQHAVARDAMHDLVSLDGERALFKDVVQRIYSDDGNGDGRMTPAGFELMTIIPAIWGSQVQEELSLVDSIVSGVTQIAAPISLTVLATRRQTTDKADQLMDEIESRFDNPYHEDELSDIETEIQELGMSYLLIQKIFPAYQQVRSAMFRASANQGGTEMAVAVYRYQQMHGELPETIDDFVGDFLNQVPVDPVGGDPLKYMRTESGFKIYGVGNDGDDDGGDTVTILADGGYPAESWTEEDYAEHETRPMRASDFTLSMPHHLDGDWVIWPRYADMDE